VSVVLATLFVTWAGALVPALVGAVVLLIGRVR
jgi:hypothetical protein